MSWLSKIANLIPTTHVVSNDRPFYTDDEHDIIAAKNIEIEELRALNAGLMANLNVSEELMNNVIMFDAGDAEKLGEGTQIVLTQGLWYIRRTKPVESWMRTNGHFDLLREDSIGFQNPQAALRFFRLKTSKGASHAE